jgi:hypothetical protein
MDGAGLCLAGDEHKMDRGTKIYAGVLALLVLALLVLFLYQDPKVSSLNGVLENDPEIADFPYPFRVLSVNDGVASLSTPRSTEVPVERVLGILFPSVSGKSPESPEFQQAQQKLAQVQNKVRKLIMADAQIERIDWRLDHTWLSQHGL